MSDEARARVLEALRKMEGDYSAFPVLESCHCADCAAMRERRQAVSQAVTIIERDAVARAEGEAAGREAAAREVENNISGSSYDGVDALLGAIAAAIRARKEGTRCD